MTQTVSFNRGRNDRRDGKPLDYIYTLTDTYDYIEWEAGWTLQESIMKQNKMNAQTEEGKKAAKNGEAAISNPHPKGTKSWRAWNLGHIIGSQT